MLPDSMVARLFLQELYISVPDVIQRILNNKLHVVKETKWKVTWLSFNWPDISFAYKLPVYTRYQNKLWVILWNQDLTTCIW